MSLKNYLRFRSLQKISKALSIDKLNEILQKYLSGEKLEPADLDAQLSEFFGRQQTLKQDSEVYANIHSIVEHTYKPARLLPAHQQEALTETIYQKATNLFHLEDYKARGTKYVQVKAILDSRTTPQCQQMNGRIFALPALRKEVPNQIPLVQNSDY
ncbi:hypothetical protein MASR2M64_15190 [Candidatus Cloacimonadota bacterium]